MKKTLLAIFCSVCFVLILQLCIVWFLRTPLEPLGAKFNGSHIHNPYKNEKFMWRKASFHLHSNSVFFTKEMSSPEEIAAVYHKHGYDIFGISDYNQISKFKTKMTPWIPEYEWGRNLRKKHFLVLGASSVEPDYFPLFSDLENLQWSIDKIKENSKFLVLNHPQLFSAYTSDDLVHLSRYDAIEVFSPFLDDSARIWDEILSNGKVVWGMASDDLHYLPAEETIQEASFLKSLWQRATFTYKREGDALTRYLLLNVREMNFPSIVDSLKTGNFALVKKFDRNLPDPKIGKISFLDQKLNIEMLDNVHHIRFVGQGGRVLKEVTNSRVADYAVKPEDTYVRAEIYTYSAAIFLNPVYREKN